MPEGKAKLTLSVDSEVVERAKNLGINISELAEQALRSFTYKPEDAEDEALLSQRDELFRAMVPLLRRYSIRVPVAKYIHQAAYGGDPDDFEEAGEVYLCGHGKFEAPGYYDHSDPENDIPRTLKELNEGDDTGDAYVAFYPTETILKNFMGAIEKAKVDRRQQVESLVIARRIVEAISQVDDRETPSAHQLRKEGTHQ
jgi:hypothetical protein